MKYKIAKVLSALKSGKSWQKILETGTADELALLFRATGTRMALNITAKEWLLIGQIAHEATTTASNKGLFWVKPRPREIWQREIGISLAKAGLLSPDEATRWFAWKARWTIEPPRAHAELVPENEGFITDIEGLPQLPEGCVTLRRISKMLGRPVLLRPSSEASLTALLESRKKRDKELGERLKKTAERVRGKRGCRKMINIKVMPPGTIGTIEEIFEVLPDNWRDVFLGADEHDLSRLAGKAGQLNLKVDNLTKEDWTLISAEAKEGADVFFGEEIKQLRFDIGRFLMEAGIRSGDPVTRWRAWFSTWELDSDMARKELCPDAWKALRPDSDIYGTKGTLPPGVLKLRRRAAESRQPVLEVPTALDLKPLLQAQEKRDRELGIRLLTQVISKEDTPAKGE